MFDGAGLMKESVMKEIKIYGSSDDIIVIEGDIVEEFGCYTSGEEEVERFLAVSDGTLLQVRYDGFWRLNVLRAGNAERLKKEGTCEDTDYTDVVTMRGDDLHWVALSRNVAQ